MAGRRRSRSDVAKDSQAFAGQCIWFTAQKRCLLRGAWSPSTSGGPLFCAWHTECSLNKSPGRERDRFILWLGNRREVEARTLMAGDARLLGEGAPTPLILAATDGKMPWPHGDEDYWLASVGEKTLPKRTVLADDPGIVSIELNQLVLGGYGHGAQKIGGLVSQVLEGTLALADARARIEETAGRIRRETESESF